jgi:TRAP-type C4-dicarboxylate transport system permease small subunit
MVHGLDTVGTAIEAVSVKEDTAGFERFIAPVNYVVTIISSIALVVAAFVLSYSVASRYFFHFSTDWQDEFSVFLIVGAVFMSGAAVQARRGHVAIEAFSTLLSPRANRIRLFLVDVASLAFCAFFARNRGSCCMKRSSKGTAPGRPGSRLCGFPIH